MSSTNGTSAARIEANRRNAQKSTGPRTAAGKEKSRFNAVKHGMFATEPVLPGENPDVLQARHDEWQRILKPKDDVDRFLVRRAVDVSWQLERADRACTARLEAARISAGLDQAAAEAEHVAALGQRLFWDQRGPIALYPHDDPGLSAPPRVSWTNDAHNPDTPEVLVHRLESLPLGCAWMIDRWTELGELIEEGHRWQAPDRLRAIRLLGRQPLDAADDRRVMEIYLACWVLEPEKRSAFDDINSELWRLEREPFANRLADRDSLATRPASPEAARQVLQALVGKEVERLEELLRLQLERRNAATAAEIEFDNSPTGEWLRRHQVSSNRTLLRILDTLRRRQREAVQAEADAPALSVPFRVGAVPPTARTNPDPGPPAAAAGAGIVPAAPTPASAPSPAPAPPKPPAATTEATVTPRSTNPPTRPGPRDGEAPAEPNDPTRRAAAAAAARSAAASTLPDRAAVSGPAADGPVSRPADIAARQIRGNEPNGRPGIRGNEPNGHPGIRGNEPNAILANIGDEPRDRTVSTLVVLRNALERMGNGVSSSAILPTVSLAAGWTLGPDRSAARRRASPRRPDPAPASPPRPTRAGRRP